MLARIRILSILAMGVALTGCSMMAPQYTASLENVQKIKDSGIQTTKVGKFEFTAGKGNANPISLRGNPMKSPYDGSYARYLEEALKQELSLAGKLKPDASVEVAGVLQQNDISLPAIGEGSGNIAARFVVTRGGETKYDQVKSVHEVWPSSFVGAVAIPRGQEKYPVVVAKLLAQLYADPAFMQALQQ
jgi:hypothetical protein